MAGITVSKAALSKLASKPNPFLLLTGILAAIAGGIAGRNVTEPPDAQAHLAVQINTHKGFDRCGNMSLSDMTAFWYGTPYWWVGTYTGGASMGSCTVHSANWVNQVEAQGWGLAFLWVPLQAPCTGYQNRMSWDPQTAYNQGRAAAESSSNQLGAMGVDEAFSVQYVDIEAYNSNDDACVTAVNAFVKGWHQRTNELFKVSGYYSNSADGIKALVDRQCWNVNGCPDIVWMANADGHASVWNDPYVADGYWVNHQRLHQYRICFDPQTANCLETRPYQETWNGVTKFIDLDCALGWVAGGSESHSPGGNPQQDHQHCP